MCTQFLPKVSDFLILGENVCDTKLRDRIFGKGTVTAQGKPILQCFTGDTKDFAEICVFLKIRYNVLHG